MKFRMNPGVLAFFIMACVLLLNSCNDDTKSCEGYTGKITNPMAESLVKRCHFLPKDSIELWVNRYEAYKKGLVPQRGENQDPTDTLNGKSGEMKAAMDPMSARFLSSGSVSYNSCIIRKILCDKNSIGLRVLYGISADNKIHIILVGIQPDYSNLYVSGEDCCDKAFNKNLGAGAGAGGGTVGGAEFGQMP